MIYLYKNRGCIYNFYEIVILTPIKIRGVYKNIIFFNNLNFKNCQITMQNGVHNYFFVL